MNIDIIIIKLILINKIYNKYINIINENHYKVNNKEIYKLYKLIQHLMEKESRDYSVEELVVAFHTTYPVLKEDDLSLFRSIFDILTSVEVNMAMAEEYFNVHCQRVKASQIASLAIDVCEGKIEYEELLGAIEQPEKKVLFPQESFVTDDLQELYNETRHVPGLRWPLDCLNQSFGSLRIGDFGFVLARPEVGKTTFLSHITTHMTRQHTGNTLWVNNEERGVKVKVRNFQSLFGVESSELFSNIPKYNDLWKKHIGNRIKMIDEAGITYKMVEQLCKEYEPELIIIDQLDKIRGLQGEGHLMLKDLYQWARELSKMYCPVIGVSQASASGEGKLYLSMEDIDGSKTGKPGEADWILGIGKEETGHDNIRGFSCIKNKLSGDDDSIEAMRHSKIKVLIVPEIARYEEFA